MQKQVIPKGKKVAFEETSLRVWGVFFCQEFDKKAREKEQIKEPPNPLRSRIHGLYDPNNLESLILIQITPKESTLMLLLRKIQDWILPCKHQFCVCLVAKSVL